MPRPVLALAALTLAFAPPTAHAATNAGACVSIYDGGLRAPIALAAQPDSGALFLSVDMRNGSPDLYAQRLNRQGVPQLGEAGVLVKAMPVQEFLSTDAIARDSGGGLVFVLSEPRGASGKDVVVHRVAPDGSRPYGPNGLVLCSANRDQTEPLVVPGPAGFYYVLWVDDRANLGSERDLYVQKVSLAGVSQWTANGALITPATHRTGSVGGVQGFVADLQGGLIVAWDPYWSSETRTQRLDASGALLWTVNGVAFGDSDDRVNGLCADGTGGVWGVSSNWNGIQTTVRAHRLGATGAQVTPASGVEYHAPGYSFQVQLARNGTGGCFVFGIEWYQSTSTTRPLFRQELSPTGVALRGTNGETILDVPGMPIIYQDGGAILIGYPQLIGTQSRMRMTVQRYGLDGTAHYPGAGIVLGRPEPGSALGAQDIALTAGGILITAWADRRYAKPQDEYEYHGFGQAVTAAGTPLWADPEIPAIQTVRDAANDQGGYVRVTWTPSLVDHPAAASLTGYRVWRALPNPPAGSLAALPAGEGMFRLGDRTLRFHANLYWEMAGEQPAATLPSYALTVPTMQDSVAGNPADQSFMVEAYDDSSHHWFSAVLIGHSVDNLAPAAVPSAAGYYDDGTTELYWGGVSAADLCCYEVFRGASPGFVPSDANRIATTAEVSFADPHGAPAFYRIAARDVHGNRGPSVLVAPAGTLDAGDVAPRVWALRPAWSRAGRTLALSLDAPHAASGRLELFDVAGRRLWSAPFATSAPRTLAFTVPGDRLPTGVVFARATRDDGQALTARTAVTR